MAFFRLQGLTTMTFEELARCLDVEGFDDSPSEIHGLLAGRIAGGERLPGEQLASALVASLSCEQELVDNALPILEALYQAIIAALESGDLSFSPLLPPDTTDLEERVLALGDWCQSFISGLGDSGLGGEQQLSDEVQNAISDLAAIAQVGFEGGGAEDDEADLFELEEYVRMAALLIFSELNTPAPPTPTLH
jgi:uncharacterized protein YgfB (UPF0149 family)